MSRAAHLSKRELQGLVTGPPQKGLGRAVSHLLTGCPQCCWMVAERVYPDYELAESTDVPGPAEGVLAQTTERADAERAAAKAQWHEIRDRHGEEALLASVQRHRTPAMVRRLCDESHGVVGDDHGRAVELAQVAIRLADLLPAQTYGKGLVNDMKAHARVRLANAQRRGSDLSASNESLAEARQFLAVGSGDPIEEAILGQIEALLRKDQERYDEALEAIDRAGLIFAKCGERHWSGKALISRAVVLFESGDAYEAISSLYAASALLDGPREPRMVLHVFHNLSLYHAELGFLDEAARFLELAEPLYEATGSHWELLHQQWLLGTLLLKRGDLMGAEEQLRTARDGFIQTGMAIEAAQISLELAASYTEQGRTSELRRLAAEMRPIFESRGLHRQALQALMFLQAAIQAEAVTAFAVGYVLDFIRKLREDDSLIFQPPAN